METGLDSVFTLALEPGLLVANLIIALICGLIISVTYRLTSDSLDHSAGFIRANVVLVMITALVIMVIGNNLARAFGLVGAMSIIRFRTAVKDVQDIVYIFFSLAAGMAAGVGLKGIAIAGTILIGAVLVVLHRMKYGSPNRHQFLLQFNCVLPDGDPPYQSLFNRLTSDAKLANMRSLGLEGQFELTFYIKMKRQGKQNELMRELSGITSIANVRLYDEDVS